MPAATATATANSIRCLGEIHAAGDNWRPILYMIRNRLGPRRVRRIVLQQNLAADAVNFRIEKCGFLCLRSRRALAQGMRERPRFPGLAYERGQHSGVRRLIPILPEALDALAHFCHPGRQLTKMSPTTHPFGAAPYGTQPRRRW